MTNESKNVAAALEYLSGLSLSDCEVLRGLRLELAPPGHPLHGREVWTLRGRGSQLEVHEVVAEDLGFALEAMRVRVLAAAQRAHDAALARTSRRILSQSVAQARERLEIAVTIDPSNPFMRPPGIDAAIDELVALVEQETRRTLEPASTRVDTEQGALRELEALGEVVRRVRALEKLEGVSRAAMQALGRGPDEGWPSEGRDIPGEVARWRRDRQALVDARLSLSQLLESAAQRRASEKLGEVQDLRAQLLPYAQRLLSTLSSELEVADLVVLLTNKQGETTLCQSDDSRDLRYLMRSRLVAAAAVAQRRHAAHLIETRLAERLSGDPDVPSLTKEQAAIVAQHAAWLAANSPVLVLSDLGALAPHLEEVLTSPELAVNHRLRAAARQVVHAGRRLGLSGTPHDVAAFEAAMHLLAETLEA